MADRDAILDHSFHESGMEDCIREITSKPYSAVIAAMDEYMKETVLEAFEYVVKNTTGYLIDKDGSVEYKYKGKWISATQLFENFL